MHVGLGCAHPSDSGVSQVPRTLPVVGPVAHGEAT